MRIVNELKETLARARDCRRAETAIADAATDGLLALLDAAIRFDVSPRALIYRDGQWEPLAPIAKAKQA